MSKIIPEILKKIQSHHAKLKHFILINRFYYMTGDKAEIISLIKVQ